MEASMVEEEEGEKQRESEGEKLLNFLAE